MLPAKGLWKERSSNFVSGRCLIHGLNDVKLMQCRQIHDHKISLHHLAFRLGKELIDFAITIGITQPHAYVLVSSLINLLDEVTKGHSL